MDADICTQLACKEDSSGAICTGKLNKKDPGAVSGKSVVVLKDNDVTARNGVVFMPNTIEMAQLKKPERGQFKTHVQISSRMTEMDIKRVLVESFPFLEGQRFYCAAAVENRTRLDFHGRPRIWDGLFIKRKIKGNSALYILTDESPLKRSYDEITGMENEKSAQSVKKDTDSTNIPKPLPCSSRCLVSEEQAASTVFSSPAVSSTTVLCHSSSVVLGATCPSERSKVFEKSDNLHPTDGQFRHQKLPDKLSPMMNCVLVPVSARHNMVSPVKPSSDSAHREKSNTKDITVGPVSLPQSFPMGTCAVMLAGGAVHAGAISTTSAQQGVGKESADRNTGTGADVPLAVQRGPHLMSLSSSGLSPPMYNLNISNTTSMQLCKELHMEKYIQKRDQSAQTGEDGKDSSEVVLPVIVTVTSGKCSTVNVLKEAVSCIRRQSSDLPSGSHDEKILAQAVETKEKSASESESQLSDSGMGTSDNIGEDHDASQSELGCCDVEMESEERQQKKIVRNTNTYRDNSPSLELHTSASKLAVLCHVACCASEVDVKAESTENKVKPLAQEEKSIDVHICPMNGPMTGGSPFYISLDECLPDDVQSGFAIFGTVGTVVVHRLDKFKLVGLNIPPAPAPGIVTVNVQTSDWQYLGKTVYTYVDEDQELLQRFISSGRLQAKFFTFLGQELSSRSSKIEQKQASKWSCSEKPGIAEHIFQRFRWLDQELGQTYRFQGTERCRNATAILQQFRHLDQRLKQADNYGDETENESGYCADDEASSSASSDDGDFCCAKSDDRNRSLIPSEIFREDNRKRNDKKLHDLHRNCYSENTPCSHLHEVTTWSALDLAKVSHDLNSESLKESQFVLQSAITDDLDNSRRDNLHGQESTPCSIRQVESSAFTHNCQETSDGRCESIPGNNRDTHESSNSQEDTEVSMDGKSKGNDFDENSASDQSRRAQYSRGGDVLEQHPAEDL